MEEQEKTVGFEQFELRPGLLKVLSELGYEEPTPIQKLAVPALLSGKDVLGQAATGTGKTAAFALPIVEKMKPGVQDPYGCGALVVVPTRELAMQVAEAFFRYGRDVGLSVVPVYGGQEISQQLRRLKRGIDVVVATPGRALDHVRRKTLRLEKVQTVILDEADEMLDLGFAEDLEELLSTLPPTRQTALFSATLPPRIAALAETYLKDPVRVRIAAEKSKPDSLPKIRQTAYLVPRAHKETALGRVLDIEAPQSAIIFCRTRLDVEKLTEVLAGHGYQAAALHGGLDQEMRDRVLRRFKAHQLELLVATDVAARGLDVEKLSHVINFDLPTSPEVYVHRIGRTGRAGREGVALTFLDSRELRLLRNIEKLTGQRIEQARLPTLVDLRARRLSVTKATVQEMLGKAEGREPFVGMVEQLAGEADMTEVAAAALQALHAQLNPEEKAEEREIPVSEALRLPPSPGRKVLTGPAARGKPGRTFERGTPRGRPDREGPPSKRPAQSGGARIFVGLGRSAGLRPADLVGAIANEAGLAAGEIGSILIADRHAFVELAEDRADAVIEALRKSTLRGRKVKVERDRGGAPPRERSPRKE